MEVLTWTTGVRNHRPCHLFSDDNEAPGVDCQRVSLSFFGRVLMGLAYLSNNHTQLWAGTDW